ncbi:MAG: GC-type dockerin domain-anchored protein [Phycisphaerae bacterium]
MRIAIHRIAAFVLQAIVAATAAGQPSVGANLGGIADWSRTHEFVDVARHARRFGGPASPWDESATLDAQGWPVGDAGVVLMCCQPPFSGLGGTYRVSFECATTPAISLVASAGTVGNVRRDAATGIVTADLVVPDSGEQLMLAFRNTQGGIRRLSVLRPGAVAGQRFTPAFLAHNDRFSALRFMDWNLTNNSPVTTWSQRTTLDHANWRDRTGVPYEVCIDLCNAVGSDMWVCVPARADDDFVRQLARLIRGRLDPSLRVYVEYSNEVWNRQFEQATWNHDRAIQEAATGDAIAYDGATDANVLRWRRIAREAVRVGRLFVQEFGAGSMGARVRPVLAGQIAWSQQFIESMRYVEHLHGRPRDQLFAMAGAPYYNLGDLDARTNLTATQVLDGLAASEQAIADTTQYETLAALTAWHGLAPFIAYEGGPDTYGGNNVLAKAQAHRDARIRPLMSRAIRRWFASGGGLYNHYASGADDWETPFGAWPLVERMQDVATPKLLAMDDAVRPPLPELTLGSPTMTEIDARLHVERPDDWASRPGPGLAASGDAFDYLVRVDRAGRHALRVRAATYDAGVGLAIEVNGQLQGTVSLPPTGAWGNGDFVWSSEAPVVLPAGQSVLRLRHLSDWRTDIRALYLSCAADFNDDGGVDGADVQAFFEVWQRGDDRADVNADGGVDGADLEAFFVRWQSGGC